MHFYNTTPKASIDDIPNPSINSRDQSEWETARQNMKEKSTGKDVF